MVKLTCSGGSLLRLPPSFKHAVRAFSCSITRQYAVASSGLTIEGKTYPRDLWTNVPSTILEQYGRQLHLQPNHPILMTRKLIESRFPAFKNHNDIPAVVTVEQNFDSLGFAQDHPGRSRADTYYINEKTLLRTHTSAHEVEIFAANSSNGFTLSADVYRRDAVDRSHYPIFHQMEGALTWDRDAFDSDEAFAKHILESVDDIPKHPLKVEDPNPTFHAERNPLQQQHTPEIAEAIATHLKRSLEDMVVTIFTEADKALAAAGQAREESQEPLRVRWIEAFFPHTSPSWELEVWWRDDWLEVLGCGVVDQKLLQRAGVENRMGWAFGIGLERIAMLLFGIPDIRLFWSKDARFLEQFDESKPFQRFQPFSKYPSAPRHLSFWLPESVEATIHTPEASKPSAAGGQLTEPVVATSQTFHENDLMEIARNIAGDNIEDISQTGTYTHPESGRKSLSYQFVYRSLEKTLTKKEIKDMHNHIVAELESKLGIEVR